MSTINLNERELIELITKMVIQSISAGELSIPIGISNRHVHLSRKDMDILFGKDVQLTKLKDLRQPGQYAAKEMITIRGPKGEFTNVRILGPLRKETQIEIAASDGFKLGIKAPIRESGQLEGTPGIQLIGPEGSLEKGRGTIVAARHIHMTPEQAITYGLKDKDTANVEVGDDHQRGAIFKNVLVRVSDQYELEMHLDLDEANSVDAQNGQFAAIVK